MRLLLTALTCFLSLNACGPAPNADINSNQTSNSLTSEPASLPAMVIASKQAYIAFLICAKNRMTTDIQKSAVNLQINTVEAIPEADWAGVSASVTAKTQAWIQTYGAACKG